MPEQTPIETRAERATEYLRSAIPFRVKTGIILGSGLGVVSKAFKTVRAIPYADIPHFPVSTVRGHRGRLILGKRARKHILIMEGRVHRYEGYPYELVTFPVRVLRRLGVSMMIVTNAAGAVGNRLRPGDIMLIEDHIDLMWKVVPGITKGPQVMHNPYYSKKFLELASDVAMAGGISAKRGVLIATTGPTYETVSEVDFARKAGAHAATMSTIPEVTLCHQLGIAVLGLSLITNVAGTHGGGHDRVIDFAERGSRNLRRLILGVIDRL